MPGRIWLAPAGTTCWTKAPPVPAFVGPDSTTAPLLWSVASHDAPRSLPNELLGVFGSSPTCTVPAPAPLQAVTGVPSFMRVAPMFPESYAIVPPHARPASSVHGDPL